MFYTNSFVKAMLYLSNTFVTNFHDNIKDLPSTPSVFVDSKTE